MTGTDIEGPRQLHRVPVFNFTVVHKSDKEGPKIAQGVLYPGMPLMISREYLPSVV